MPRHRSAGQIERERREAMRDIAKTDEKLRKLKDQLTSGQLSLRELTETNRRIADLEAHLIRRKRRLANFEKKVQSGD